MICLKKKKRFSCCPRAKVGHQEPRGSARAQPCPCATSYTFPAFHPNEQTQRNEVEVQVDNFMHVTVKKVICPPKPWVGAFVHSDGKVYYHNGGNNNFAKKQKNKMQPKILSGEEKGGLFIKSISPIISNAN